MNGINGLILLLFSVVFAVVIGTKTKCNLGIMGLLIAFIDGIILFGQKPSQIVSFFPTSLFFTMFIVSFFYGYAAENRSLELISQWLIYFCRKKLKALPLFLYITTALVSATGAGAGVAPAIMAPIAFGLINKVGFHPIMAILAVTLGSLCGGIQPWTSSGAMFYGIAETYLGEANAISAIWSYGFLLLIAPTIFFTVTYLLYAKNSEISEITIERPQTFNKEQKHSMLIIVFVMLAIVLPVLVNNIAHIPAVNWLSKNLDIRVLCTFGILLNTMLKTGNSQTVISKHIPWSTIIMVCGMSTLIEMFASTGVADVFGNWLGTSIPHSILIPCVVLFGGLLSFITTGPSVIFPLFLPMFTSLSANTGISIVALTIALFAGVGATGMSPFSQGGAMALSGCESEAVREKIWRKQLLFSLLFMSFYFIISFTGIFEFAASLYE